MPWGAVGLKKARPTGLLTVAVVAIQPIIWLLLPVDGLYLQPLLLLSALLCGSFRKAVNPLGTPSVKSTMTFALVGSLSMAAAFFSSWYASQRPSEVLVSVPTCSALIIVSILSALPLTGSAKCTSGPVPPVRL